MQGECLQELLHDNNFQVTLATSCQEAEKLIGASSYVALVVQTAISTQEEMATVQRLLSLSAPSPLILVASAWHVSFLVNLWHNGVFAFLAAPHKYVKLKELIAIAVEHDGHREVQKIISAIPCWIEVNVPAQPTYLIRLTSFFECLLHDLADQEQKRIIYAFRELVQNAMEHGNHFCTTKNINIRFVKSQEALIFQVEDEGPGFDMQILPHAVGSKKNTALDVVRYRKQTGMRPGGLGISTILGIADDLVYNQKGNAVIMIKYLNKKVVEAK
jgi:anti-sigma regulatory factor (Ser/Thr protein kinase)